MFLKYLSFVNIESYSNVNLKECKSSINMLEST